MTSTDLWIIGHGKMNNGLSRGQKSQQKVRGQLINQLIGQSDGRFI